MAGQGKGVLRIAIEDFFTTTKIGKWISNWFIEWGELQEQAIYDSYKDIFSMMDRWAKDPSAAIPQAPTPGEPPKQGEIAAAVGFAGQVGMGAASGMLAPVMRLLNYKMDRGYQSARADPSILAMLNFRNPDLFQQLKGDMDDLGWDDKHQNAWFEVSKPLFAVGDAISMYHRGLLTLQETQAEIMKQGFRIDNTAKLIEIGKQLPGISDLVHMADRFAWDDSIARRFQYDTLYPAEVQAWVEKLGFDKDWFIKYWRSHWELPSLQTVFELFHRLRPGRTSSTFTSDDLQAYLRTTPIPPYFHPRLTDISYNPYTRVDVRRMYKAGIIDQDEVYQTYLDLGYDDEHAKNLAEFTKKWATGEDSSLMDKQTNLTESLLADMYSKGVIEEGTLRSELAKLHYPSQYIDWLVKYSQSKRKVDTTPDEYPTYQTKMKNEVLLAYTSRQISASDASTALQGAGFQAQAIQWLLQAADYDYLQGQRNNTLGLIHDSYLAKIMDRTGVINALGKLNVSGNEQTQLLTEWDTDIQYRTKRLSESDYTSALRLGIISQDKYVNILQGLGLSDDDITIKLALYQAAQTTAQADQQAQKVKEAQTAAKKLSVTDLLDGYAKGTITEKQLYDRLQTAGFTTDDISMLISISYNAPHPTQSKLTVAQIMTALKRGALTVQEVTTMLTARGYTADDIDILLASQATGGA